MIRSAKYLFLSILFIVLTPSVFFASTMFPLEPPDTSSPRATLKSFIHYTNEVYLVASSPNEDFKLELEYLQRAARCFDFSKVPPTLLSDVSVESVLRLREILDRFDLPDMNDVPDKEDVKSTGLDKWRMPHTEIIIGKVVNSPRSGAFLFTPETVRRLEEFYNEIRYLPYVKNDLDVNYNGIYEQYIYSSGWMIPDGFLSDLPAWMKRGYFGQAVWQWVGIFLLLGVGLFLIWVMWLINKRMKCRFDGCSWEIGRLLFPFSGMFMCGFLEYLIARQVNITGQVLAVFIMGLEAVFFIFSGIAIIVTGNVVIHGIISSSKINEEALDADVIKLVVRLVTFCLVFILFYNAGSYFGVPVTAVFASAGIAGVAVALAARETLANFFGGVSIFMDRPFRAGDYIVLESGERGEVKAVGMRSTRLLTRDDILITIPNSVITNVKITNQSLPEPHFRVRIKIGVAYGSDVDKVEALLLEEAHKNALVVDSPAPRVRFRAFGDSSLEYELLCWAGHPQNRGRVVHEISRDIYKKFNSEGILIPFPQRDVHLHATDWNSLKEKDEA
ncbi:MscS family membrane protein [Maridesulfovibrio ferrireducens]|uniref:MscS family membrane protein n=1 Tax=Maridesulfovibrio ferrireducens TaxID=246191 RepID=A0A1G9CKJ0_9BACT|nr:mechanosensitive ion channel family protein [Maridesulfovibrio ferrireducens]SDK51994.1 MscS family membrane protein [Maridesulfovibrio ferrireducens]